VPRPNPPRSLRSESNLARRIAHERDRHGMTYEGLAKRMTDLGCPIQASAIYKIEKSKPPRRITVDELVAFAEVFGVQPEQMLLPPEVVESAVLRDLLHSWEEARANAVDAKQAEEDALAALQRFATEREDREPLLHHVVREWVEAWAPSPDTDTTEALWMYIFTDSEQWSELLAERLDERRKARGRG
jgi:transcriptional regulator with XRE-family HTH domain